MPAKRSSVKLEMLTGHFLSNQRSAKRVRPERVCCERSNILATTSKSSKEHMPLLKVLDLTTREKVEKDQDASKSELSEQNDGQVLNERCGV